MDEQMEQMHLNILPLITLFQLIQGENDTSKPYTTYQFDLIFMNNFFVFFLVYFHFLSCAFYIHIVGEVEYWINID